MAITFDPAKREKTLSERGLDFSDAEVVFAGLTLEVEDIRMDYGGRAFFATAFWKARWSWWATPRVARIATSSA